MADVTGDRLDEAAPVKLCECGCGQSAPIASKTRKERGQIRGQPVRYKVGHAMRGKGKPFSAETMTRILDANGGKWPGGRPMSATASVNALHDWLGKHYPKTGICEVCGEEAKTDYSLIHGREYSRNRNDYRELCRLCHVHYDQLGTHRSDETRARMSAAQRKIWADTRERGIERRTARGVERGLAKLTDQAVVDIRRAYAQGATLPVLAARYGVHLTTIHKAATGETWTHVAEPPVAKPIPARPRSLRLWR